MALNAHERDTINALIARVNDMLWEYERINLAGERMIKAVPFGWLRRRMGLDKWPLLAKYEMLQLFVDTAPVIPDGHEIEPLVQMLKRGGKRGGQRPSNTIPGYFERESRRDETFSDDFDDDTGA